MTQHKWKPTTLNHGTMQCEYCHCTEREAAFALGMECSSAPATPPTPATEEPWEGPLTDKENAMLEAAWQKHKDAAPPTPATEEREAVARATDLEVLVMEIGVDVAELPDRTSPDDQPDMMLVNFEELQIILSNRIAPFVAAEILAAEANERARISEWLRDSGDLQDHALADAIDEGVHTEWANEHGSGK